mgnify:CR=1 FL=1
MFKRMCLNCGKQMLFKEGIKIRQFCSKQCSEAFKEKEYNHPSNGPVMPHLKAENITDEGYIALVKALVSRTSLDVTHFKPGTRARMDAEQFFESDYFTALTGLDGEPILRKLHEEYERKYKHKKNRYRMRKIRCVETGVEYESINAAAADYNVSSKSLYDALHDANITLCGWHWRYVEE